MGFFADIIRDSRRGGVASRTPEAPLSRGGEEMPSDAPVAGAATPATAAEPAASVTSVIQLREEGSGQPLAAGQSPVQNGAVTRQVVGPSPSEHIPAASLPEAIQQGVTPPNPVAREQAGSESDRTVTGDFSVEQIESFHDGGSNVVPLVLASANDSLIREALSGYAASRIGKVSVETQGRRQAGITRAGSTTPFVESAAEKVEDSFVQPNAVTAANDSRQDSAEATPHPSAAQNPLPKPLPSLQDTQPEVIPEEVFRAPVPPDKLPLVGLSRQEVLAGAMSAVNQPDPAGVLLAAERFRKAPERDLPPFQRRDDQKGMPVPPLPHYEPRVSIGTIEVVVVAPAPAERPSRSEERSRPDLASRHYLRNF